MKTFIVRLKKIFLLPAVLFILILSSQFAGAQTWTKITGPNSCVNKIFCPIDDGSKVIVGSDALPTDILEQNISFPIVGNGYLISTDSGKTFPNYNLNEFSVYDIVQVPSSSNVWIASARRLTRGGLTLSTDNGTTWQYTDQLHCDGTQQVMKLAMSQLDPLNIYGAATNASKGFVKLSYQTGSLTDCLYDDALTVQSLDIAVSPLNQSMLFIAGDNSIAGGVWRSTDKGATWQQSLVGLQGLRILSVLASKYDQSVVYCGADSLTAGKVSIGKGIYQSLDTGKTWHLVGAPNGQVFQIAEHPLNPKYLAAACGTDGVWISASFGWGWSKFSDGLPAASSVRRIGIPAWNINTDGFVAFAGTYSDGLFVSKRIISGVVSELPVYNGLRIVEIFPQPAAGDINFKWENPLKKVANIKLMDELGNVVYTDILNNQFVEGYGTIPTGSLANGVYMLNIQAAGESITTKVIISR
jgi:hypothetical protein